MDKMKLTTSDTPPASRGPMVICRECGAKIRPVDGTRDIHVNCPVRGTSQKCPRKENPNGSTAL